MVKARESMGETRKEAIAEVAKEAGVPKRAVFDLMVGSKRS
jgi:16S rRNA (cytidine1402-2'-O)-methyltransferase